MSTDSESSAVNHEGQPEEGASKVKLPNHVRPNVSRLEAFRSLVAEARRGNWPYRRIVTYLDEQHDLKICAKSIRLFCKRRGIKKGVGETESAKPIEATRPIEKRRVSTGSKSDVLSSIVPKFKKKTVFMPREGPARTRSNGGLDESD